MTAPHHLRQLHKRATAGQWDIERIGSWLVLDDVLNDIRFPVADCSHREDAEFIAAARNALPALLDIAEAAERQARYPHLTSDELREALDRLNTTTP